LSELKNVIKRSLRGLDQFVYRSTWDYFVLWCVCWSTSRRPTCTKPYNIIKTETLKLIRGSTNFVPRVMFYASRRRRRRRRRRQMPRDHLFIMLPPPGRRASATWQHNVISDNSATWCNENDNGHKRRYLDNAGWWWDRKIPRLNPSCSLTHVYLSVAEKLGQEHNNLAPRQEFTRSVIVGLMVSNGNLPQVLWDRHLQRAMTCINLALCIGDFLSAKTASASVRLSHRNSVRLSVRLSHRWISQKRCKLGSSNFHRRLPGKL